MFYQRESEVKLKKTAVTHSRGGDSHVSDLQTCTNVRVTNVVDQLQKVVNGLMM